MTVEFVSLPDQGFTEVGIPSLCSFLSFAGWLDTDDDEVLGDGGAQRERASHWFILDKKRGLKTSNSDFNVSKKINFTVLGYWNVGFIILTISIIF